MDKFFIRGLTIDAIIGVKPYERVQKQPISIDLELAYDMHAAAVSDDLTDTLNYDDIIARLQQFVSGSEFFLIEKLAANMAEFLFNEFPIQWLKIKLHKALILNRDQQVGVIIERNRATDHHPPPTSTQ